MPILLGDRRIKRINYLVTDGESQEFGKLDIEINKYFPIIIHLRWYYHLVPCGYGPYNVTGTSSANKIFFNVCDYGCLHQL